MAEEFSLDTNGPDQREDLGLYEVVAKTEDSSSTRRLRAKNERTAAVIAVDLCHLAGRITDVTVTPLERGKRRN